MIRWLTDTIGTGPYNEVIKLADNNDFKLIDVRELVDKSGNNIAYIQGKINEALAELKQYKKIVVCCDYGMSRSNSIAIGVIAQSQKIPLYEAVKQALKVVEETDVKLEMLNSIYEALNFKASDRSSLQKNILITGGNGFIGNKLKHLLAEKKLNSYSPGEEEISLINDSISFDLYVKSNKVDTIVHLAQPKFSTHTSAMGEALVMLKNVLETCRLNGVRLIYVSGWEIYNGYTGQLQTANADQKPNPKGTYAETKWLCECLIRQYETNYGIKAAIVRPGYVYGDLTTKPTFIDSFIKKARTNQDILIHEFKNGLAGLDMLHADDLTAALAKVIEKDLNGEFNLGSGSFTLVKTVAETICSLLNSTSLVKSIKVDDDTPMIILDKTVSEKVLNWTPVIDLRTGLKKMM